MRLPQVTETIIIATIGFLVILSAFIFNELSQISKLRQIPETPVPTSRYHFALIYQEEKNPYWDAVKDGIRQASSKYNVQFEFMGPEVTDMVEQVDLLNRAIASRVDGIIVQGMNEEAFTPVINKAVERGIPVLTIDSDAPLSKRMSYVGSDNYQAGVMVGEHIAKVLRGQGQIGIILGNFHATNQQQRLKGIQDVLKRFPQIQIVNVYDSGGNQFEAASLTLNLLQDHPDLDLLVGLSQWDGPGIGQTLKRLQMKRSQMKHDLHVLVFDDLPETKSYFMDGTVDDMVVEDPLNMGYRAVEIMMDIKNGRNVPNQVNTQVKLLEQK